MHTLYRTAVRKSKTVDSRPPSRYYIRMSRETEPTLPPVSTFEDPAFTKDQLRNFRNLRISAVDAAIVNHTNGFISIGWMNREIDPVRESRAADLVHQVFEDNHPTHILGIGSSGIPFGDAVHNAFGGGLNTGQGFIDFIEATKLEHGVRRPHGGMEFGAYSYTRGEVMQFHVPEIPEGSRVLVVDDVIARGSVSIEAVKELQVHGITVVGFAAYMSKDFQNGMKSLSKVTTVPAFAVLRFDGIDADTNRPILTPEEEALKPVVSSAGKYYPTDRIR